MPEPSRGLCWRSNAHCDRLPTSSELSGRLVKLKLEGSYSFEADRQTVWDALLSPDVLASCIPGCQKFEPSGEDAYDVVVEVRMGAIAGTYTGRFTLTDKIYLESYRMLVEGEGRCRKRQSRGRRAVCRGQRRDTG